MQSERAGLPVAEFALEQTQLQPLHFPEAVSTVAAKGSSHLRRRPKLPLRVASNSTRLLDWLAILLLGYLLTQLPIASRLTGDKSEIIRLAVFAATLFVVLAEMTGAYLLENILSTKQFWWPVLNAWSTTILFLAALFLTFGLHSDTLLHVLLLVGGMGIVSIAGGRMILMPALLQLRRGGYFNKRTAVLGTGTQAEALARYVLHHEMLTISLVGFYDDLAQADGGQPSHHEPLLPHLGGMAELVHSIRSGLIDKVIIAMPWSAELRLQATMRALATTPVDILLAPEWAGFKWARRPVHLLGELPVLTLLEKPLSGWRLFLKAVEDRVLALLALILLAPVMILAAIAIKLDSPGPVLFRQLREGYNCRPFPIMKFRTMQIHQCTPGDVIQATRHDPRVTRVGAFLRRTSIDELPQLINVLTGAMSLVGPRPHSPSTRAGGKLFAEIEASYATRHNVKPGLTGWAQVCGWRGETTSEEMLIKRLQHDLYYIEHCSIVFDLYILVRTVLIVMFQRTAY